MKPSTRAFFRLHGWRHPLGFLHGYIYGRWVNTYLKVITGKVFKRRKASVKTPSRNRGPQPQSGVGRWFEERYHSKVLTHEDAGKIVKLNRPLRVENPERVIPYEIANRIVLDTPGSLAVMRCPCREIQGGGVCGPLEVCMVIGKPYVDFVVEHGTNGARHISREEGMEILAAARDSGWVHTAWFKDAMAGRFYAICNCCSCCCIPTRAMNRTGHEARYLAPSGYLAVVDPEACSACGSCQKNCSFGAIGMGNGLVVIDQEKCLGCGVCENLCPDGAATMVLAPDKGVPFDVEALS
jgi:NAD-dependent dihydropyrimidine dehydrogenase PreA subunit